jgi:hypothetical protein
MANENHAETEDTPTVEEYTPVSSIVQREIHGPVEVPTRGTMTRASHRNWKRTFQILRSLGKRR